MDPTGEEAVTRVALCAALVLPLALAACTPEQADVWCRTHTQQDLSLSRQAVNAMTPADKRKYLRILEEGARLCGWRPGR